MTMNNQLVYVVMQKYQWGESELRYPRSVFFDREEAWAYCKFMNNITDPTHRSGWWVNSYPSYLNPELPEGETSWVEAAEKANNV